MSYRDATRETTISIEHLATEIHRAIERLPKYHTNHPNPSKDPYYIQGQSDTLQFVSGLLESKRIDPELKSGDLISEYSDDKFARAEWVFIPRVVELDIVDQPFISLATGIRLSREDLPRLIERLDR